MFLDIAEAGGIPLGIAFVLFHFAPLLNRDATRSLIAGIFGIAVNNLFDTACLWLTVYPHFWVVLALFGPGNFQQVRFSQKSAFSFLAILLLFASILPAVEDHE